MSDRAHPRCWTEKGYVHVCQAPSGRICIEGFCGEPAGTWWGPLWCPDCDVARLDWISAALQRLRDMTV